MRESRNNSNSQGQPNGGQRRRRHRPHRGSGGPRDGQGQPHSRSGGTPKAATAENRNRDFQSSGRRRAGRPLTSNQILVKYDNLLEQHLIMRRKYYEYFNRVDERQLRRLEKNFFASIEHLRRFEANLEPWQREVLEKRKTERYALDLTYSHNHGLDQQEMPQVEISEEEIEDPHFKDTQKEAFEEYKEDTEESVGTFEDYLKLKGLN